MDDSGPRSTASSRLKSRKVLGMGGQHGHKSKIVRLLGLDDFITRYPSGFQFWRTSSAALFMLLGFTCVGFPGFALSLVGEYREEGSNYMAIRLYGATVAGLGIVDWITPASAYSLVLCASLLRCSYFFFASMAMFLSYVADDVSERLVWWIGLNVAFTAISIFYLYELKAMNSPRRREPSQAHIN
eukprot:m.9302 g.9302  ORF g.9302 m.9302 type:complete len:186 (+) comp21256_c0_seq2:62-619(+)